MAANTHTKPQKEEKHAPPEPPGPEAKDQAHVPALDPPENLRRIVGGQQIVRLAAEALVLLVGPFSDMVGYTKRSRIRNPLIPTVDPPGLPWQLSADLEQGFEFDGTVRPFQGFSLFTSIAYLDSKFLDYPKAPGLPGCALRRRRRARLESNLICLKSRTISAQPTFPPPKAIE